MKNKTKIILAILITFVLTLSICSFAMVRILSKYSYPFEKLEKVMSIIDSSYVGEYSFEKCEESAINGILEALGDDYAAYYDEENAKETMQMIEGHYIGIGIEVLANFNKGYIEVMSAFEDSPADRAGIKGGDLIKSIDGTLYKATDMTDAVFYMKGISVENPLDKPIEIVLIRNGEEFSVKLHRAEIDMYKVTHRIVDDICYIRYSGFTIESQKALGPQYGDPREPLTNVVPRRIVVDGLHPLYGTDFGHLRHRTTHHTRFQLWFSTGTRSHPCARGVWLLELPPSRCCEYRGQYGQGPATTN